MDKKFVLTLSVLFALAFAFSANAAIFPNRDLIAPDSPLYFLQTWKESIQTFFTFGLENKAKQYLHLAEVRLDEYKKMLEKGTLQQVQGKKLEIAQRTLEKYQNQLNRALQKAEELKNKGKDMADLNEKIEQAVSKHLEVLRENLQKAPEQAKKGLENAMKNSRKSVENVLGKKLKKERKEENGVCIQVITPAKNPKTGECKEFPTPCDVPQDWQEIDSCSTSQIDTLRLMAMFDII